MLMEALQSGSEEDMFKLLSYPLSPDTPRFADNPAVEITIASSIAEGGVANWLSFTTINHNGTHIDAPYHFSNVGKRVTDLSVAELVFTAPVIVDIPKEDGELITDTDIIRHGNAIEGADLLLIRTGWASRYRFADPIRYGSRAPGFHSSAGHYLINELPSLGALAMDLPSASSPIAGEPNEEGLEFHRIVLGSYRSPDERYVLLVEDVRIDAALETAQLQRVIVAPLWLQDADAAPVTIFAETR
jgi:arylformamidase